MTPADSSPAIVGVDIGGTFTDLVALDAASGIVTLGKVPTVPGRLQDGLRAGLQSLQRTDGQRLGEVRHGTTVVTNALLERRFARTALLCTRGFRDTLELRRLWREHLFGHDWERPVTLIPRSLRLEIDERVGSKGEILRPLDEDQARAVARDLRAAGVESVAISFLFSFLEPAHERRVAEIIREECPGWPSRSPPSCCRKSTSTSAPAPPPSTPSCRRSCSSTSSGWTRRSPRPASPGRCGWCGRTAC